MSRFGFYGLCGGTDKLNTCCEKLLAFVDSRTNPCVMSRLMPFAVSQEVWVK